jgi:hypothetical protein
MRNRPIAGTYLYTAKELKSASHPRIAHGSSLVGEVCLKLVAPAPLLQCGVSFGTGAGNEGDVRLDRVGHGVEEILDLAGLVANGIQRAWVTRSLSATGTTKRILVTQVVTGGPTYLRHDDGDERREYDEGKDGGREERRR